MFNYIRSIIAGLLVSIGIFVSPVKQITPTPQLKISITITPKATATIIPTPVIIVTQLPQAQKCQFNKDGFINKARELGYSEEEINIYLSEHPGNCINITKNTSVSQQIQDIEPTSSYEYEQPYRYSPPTPVPTIAIDVYGQGGSSYTQYGNTVYGSDGSSYSKYGNTIYGNDGSTYTKYGNTTYGNDSSSYSQYGNTTYGNDGSTYTKYGNTTYGNDGSTCTKYGNSTYCN